MLLSRVTYHLFRSDIENLPAKSLPDWHQIDGELKLTFADAQPLFISWDSEPVTHSIQIGNVSFFAPNVLVEVQMENHPFWRPLASSEIKMDFFDNDHQVLHIHGLRGSVFLSSQYDNGTFKGDCIRISSDRPFLPDEL